MHENGQRLDAALGDGFAFVTSPERRDHVETLAGGRFAGCRATVTAAEPEQLPFVLGRNNAVFVRPDRTVAAVIDFEPTPQRTDSTRSSCATPWTERNVRPQVSSERRKICNSGSAMATRCSGAGNAPDATSAMYSRNAAIRSCCRRSYSVAKSR